MFSGSGFSHDKHTFLALEKNAFLGHSTQEIDIKAKLERLRSTRLIHHGSKATKLDMQWLQMK
jgi:hypothetical protein